MTLSEDGQAKLDFIYRAAALAGVTVTYMGGFKTSPFMEVWKGIVKIKFLCFTVDSHMEAWARIHDMPHKDVFTSLPDKLILADCLTRWRAELHQAIEHETLTDFRAIAYLTAVLQDP